MHSSPSLTTNVDGIGPYYNDNFNTASDPTTGLNERLNAYVPQVLTNPPMQRADVPTNGDVGLPDSTYNVGYKMLPVDNQVVEFPSVMHYESPEVPVTQLPFLQALYNSTLVQEQVNGKIIYSSLRAPGINEGYN